MRLSLILLFVACSDPQAMVIPPDPNAWSSEAFVERLKSTSQELSQEEAQRLASFLMRQSLTRGEIPPTGITVREAIEAQAAWETAQQQKQIEADLLAARVRAEREQRLTVLREAVSVALVEFQPRDANPRAGRYSQDIALSLAYRNNSTERTVTGVRGVMTFYDLFETPIKQVRFALEEPLRPSTTELWVGSVDINPFIQDEANLWGRSMNQIHTVWEPEIILFDDGTSLRP